MKLTPDNFEQFGNDNYDLLRETLAQQFEKHFDLLVQSVPSIKSIEWTSSQEDEMAFDLTFLKVEKNNGYVYEYESYDSYGSGDLSSEEFNAQEIELIKGFKTYLESLSHLIVTLWGSTSFRLETEQVSVATFCSKNESEE